MKLRELTKKCNNMLKGIEKISYGYADETEVIIIPHKEDYIITQHDIRYNTVKIYLPVEMIKGVPFNEDMEI